MSERARSASIRTGLGRRVGFATLLVAGAFVRSDGPRRGAELPDPASRVGHPRVPTRAEIGARSCRTLSRNMWALFSGFGVDFVGRRRETGRSGGVRRDDLPADHAGARLRQRGEPVEPHHAAHPPDGLQRTRFRRASTVRPRGGVLRTCWCRWSSRLPRGTGSSARDLTACFPTATDGDAFGRPAVGGGSACLVVGYRTEAAGAFGGVWAVLPRDRLDERRDASPASRTPAINEPALLPVRQPAQRLAVRLRPNHHLRRPGGLRQQVECAGGPVLVTKTTLLRQAAGQVQLRSGVLGA